ncbi:PAS domain-containing protein [Xinfangfangia sp. CPCC 101601]|uniref:PAS domain-containing protein n=1 Tax=Pseudogemmobacter lacusdianii TaxID=3069608 RepID=A0ABU0VWW1_9RHOB|nr:PAS domain-containing protein [Xinfangfangia sp. CPCC 101601]MDQ2066213.1 PAS domain-containing protein [Xinfangfangia sp. CPCC 101601]
MQRAATEISPGSGRELTVPADGLIYSRTDPSSLMLSANTLFRQLAGYDLPELRGAPHNIIRHPDMPRGFFHQFWSLLKSGEPAVGYVKNRSKDGSYYWILACAIVCDGGYFSIRIRASSPLFSAVRDEYAALRRRELAEELTPAQSAEILLARLAELGFDSYHSFMAQAIADEIRARNQALGRLDDADGDYLSKLVSLLVDAQKVQTRLVAQFQALMLLPVNMRLIAARLEPQGGPISQISMNYKTASDEIAGRLSSFVSGEANLSLRMAAGVRRSLVLTHCARLQAEVVARGNNEDEALNEAERRNESRILHDVAQSCGRQAQDALIQAGRIALDLTDAANDVRRMVLGLDTIRILGRVESRRDLMSESSMSATIDQIDKVQGQISVSLKELNDLTSAIHAQLSMLQRPLVAVAAE